MQELKQTKTMKKRVNFILIGEPKEPIPQQWQIELGKFNRSKTLLLPPPEIKPLFLKFKKRTADRLALATIPGCLIIQSLITAILFSQINFRNIFWWLFAIPIVTLLVILVYKTIAQVINERRVKIHNNSIPNNISVFVYDGNPGAGKTSSIANDEKHLADFMWSQICEKYAMYEPFLDEIQFWPQKEKEDALEIIEAYNFYQNSGTYPCLWSTVPMFIDGVPVNKLTADHLLQRERLPYGAVCLIDETSLVLPQELFKDKPYEIIEMCKFPRHFGDFHYGSTEQDEDSNIIYLRRVAGRRLHLLQQEWVQKPRLLLWIYNKLFNLRSRKPFTKKTVNFFKLFNQYIRSFGYRKYWYTEEGFSKVQSFVLKPNLCLEYDDRCYKNAYRCLNKPLNVSKWEYLRPSKRDIDEIFSDELKQRAKSKAQIKSEAIQKRRKNSGKKTTKSNTT